MRRWFGGWGYVETVRVTGPDPHGLDADNEGSAASEQGASLQRPVRRADGVRPAARVGLPRWGRHVFGCPQNSPIRSAPHGGRARVPRLDGRAAVRRGFPVRPSGPAQCGDATSSVGSSVYVPCGTSVYELMRLVSSFQGRTRLGRSREGRDTCARSSRR